ncbi:MAG TPA: hypothetical protein PK544_12090 [Spirochaetota bacterium]|nr:hypothetical protein [Spirochaetota bacterium]HPQ51677.1 hypothetical protein [Spirochaetota bacterium]
MQSKNAEVLTIKRLKKDGSAGRDAVEKISGYLSDNHIVLVPIDNVYCVVSLSEEIIISRFGKEPFYCNNNVKLISSYKMLNGLAEYSKSDYDFLNRIWPGEVTVALKGRRIKKENIELIRFPKNKFSLDIIERAGTIIQSAILLFDNHNVVYKKRDIIKYFKESVDLIVIVDELCKKHPLPTYIDIRNNSLNILQEGKISAEEIKSLYFLGKADDVV